MIDGKVSPVSYMTALHRTPFDPVDDAAKVSLSTVQLF